MNIWELPKEHYNWESPITKIYGDIHNEIIRQDEENCIFAIKQAIGYEVDKDELIKALQYDREQYDKGYRDGLKEKFIEELEKIKAEFEQEYDAPYESYPNTKIGLGVAIGYINKRLDEVKGENNG